MTTSTKIKVWSIAATLTALAPTSQAQPYYVAGDYNGWANPSATAMTSGPSQYDYTITGQTAGNFGGLKVTDGTWNNTWPGNNLMVQYNASGSAVIHYYPGSPGDGWLPLAHRVGYDDPGNASFEVIGDFTSWNSDPKAQMTGVGNGVYTVTYVVPTAGTYGFKFRTPGTWSDANIGSDFGGGGNASLTTATNNQPVLFQLDLPNGRWIAGSPAPPPVTNQVVFAVDMTVQIELGFFTPGSYVYAAGDFNNWPNPGTTGLALTNYPPYNGGSNTNIYYGTNTLIGVPNSAVASFKFNNNDVAAPNAGWETSGNRSVSLLATNGTLLLPVGLFSDVGLSDYAATDVAVTFIVNMTNAVSRFDGHVFDPQNDQVYLNGGFLPGGWAAWNPISLLQMQNDPIGSQLYTYTVTLPARSANSLIRIDYKYGMGYGGVTNYDNEAVAYSDHFRYVRATATGAYTNAMDTFGDQYTEPSFGQLTSAASGAGTVAISWLGRPGVQLQVTTNLAATWQSLAETDGTNWTTGTSSTNGFVSQTNWPASGVQFFRLIQAW